MSRSCLAVLLFCLFITACQTRTGTRESWPYPQPAPREPGQREIPPYGQPQTLPPQPGEVDLSSYPRAAEDISGAAVTSLVTQARELLATDRLDQAAATLERALRIEPRNAFVWSLLAQTQLKRANYEQAESVAQKANSLARGNPYVELENWRVIAAARSGRGDAIGALQAQDRAQALEARLQAVSP